VLSRNARSHFGPLRRLAANFAKLPELLYAGLNPGGRGPQGAMRGAQGACHDWTPAINQGCSGMNKRN
jgi:hypothetical protein